MTKVTLSIANATRLAMDALESAGLSNRESAAITSHLIDCELRGLGYSGLARAVSIVERVTSPKYSYEEISTTQTSEVVASIDGGNRPGYLVAQHAVNVGLTMAQTHGLASVGAFNTWYSGMLSYYLEQITERGFIGIMSAAGPSRVAPHGSTQALFGTNPLAVGFPTTDKPIILDIGTSSIMYAEVILAGRLGMELPTGTAFDKDGQPTRDPEEALNGAFAPWGGHKGSGLALAMHLLGMAAGHGLEDKKHNSDASFMLFILDPRKFHGGESFRERASEFAESVRNSRPADTSAPVRMPFDRSAARREETRIVDEIQVSERIVDLLQSMTRNLK